MGERDATRHTPTATATAKARGSTVERASAKLLSVIGILSLRRWDMSRRADDAIVS